MKKASTIILRITLILTGLVVLVFCIAMPWMLNLGGDPDAVFAHLRYPVLVGVYLTALAFFYALYNGVRLLGYVAKGWAFSLPSIKALKGVKLGAFAVSAILSAGGVPLFYLFAQLEDAPGLVLIGMAIAGVPFVFALSAYVLQWVVQEKIAAEG